MFENLFASFITHTIILRCSQLPPPPSLLATLPRHPSPRSPPNAPRTTPHAGLGALVATVRARVRSGPAAAGTRAPPPPPLPAPNQHLGFPCGDCGTISSGSWSCRVGFSPFFSLNRTCKDPAMNLARATCLYFPSRQKGRSPGGIPGQESWETESSRTCPRGGAWGPRGAFPGTRDSHGGWVGSPAAPRVPHTPSSRPLIPTIPHGGLFPRAPFFLTACPPLPPRW